MTRRAILLIAAIAALAAVAPIRAAAQALPRGTELRVITADDSPATRQIVQGLLRRYPSLQSSQDPRTLAARKGPAVYLAVGPAALSAAVAADLDGPIVSAFTSSSIYNEIVGQSRRRSGITGIYAEASPIHQLLLTSQLYGRRVTVGVLTSQNTEYLEPLIRQGARSSNLDVEFSRVEPGENVLRALTRLGMSTAILAVPDPLIYTPANLRNILESTYRRNQPVIGFSTSLVTAGTMATAYSTIDDILAQLEEVLDTVASGRITEPQFPRYWRVAINENVARSLNVVVNDEVRSMGERPPERSR